MKLPRFWLVVRSVTPRSKSSNAKTVKQLLVISAIDSVSTWTPASRTSVLPWETLNYAASSGVGFLSTKTKVTDTAGSYHEFTWSRCHEVARSCFCLHCSSATLGGQAAWKWITPLLRRQRRMQALHQGQQWQTVTRCYYCVCKKGKTMENACWTN